MMYADMMCVVLLHTFFNMFESKFDKNIFDIGLVCGESRCSLYAKLFGLSKTRANNEKNVCIKQLTVLLSQE